jgi:hypothetical protein
MLFTLFKIDYREPEIKIIENPVFFVGLSINTTARNVGLLEE